MGSKPPKVFISYSHDSPVHAQHVLELAERLRNDGVNAVLDQYVAGTPSKGWPRWMLDQLDWAGFVLVVCTEIYYLRFRGHDEPGKGKGADWEGNLVTMEMYNTKSRIKKFVPVFFASQDEQFIPEPVSQHTHYLLNSEDNYAKLYDFLTGQAGLVPGKLGALKTRARQAVDPLRFAPSHAYTRLASVETYDVSPFQTAGMLPYDHSTYVPRECDRQLAEFLIHPNIVCIAINGDFEIGKSSLMMRAAGVLGPDWIIVGGGLGDLRSDRPDLCVDNFFQLFTSHFGRLDSWPGLRQRLVEQPVLLLLDDLGEMLAPGAQAVLPGVISAALAANGNLRVVATLPVRIDQYLRDRGLGNPRYHRPWHAVSVRPFNEPQAKRLLSILPAESCAVAERLFTEVERRSALKPRPLQCLADRLWHAHRHKADDVRRAAIVRDSDSYT
jgi:SEFIR domain-containing protein